MSPYREVEHTADWALQVWAPTLADLFIEAARGMYALAGAAPEASAAGSSSRPWRRIELGTEDFESLLVAWLQELLYITESEGLAFDEYRILCLEPTRLKAEVSGDPVEPLTKVIKAVTYHNLSIRQTPEGYETTIVFDV